MTWDVKNLYIDLLAKKEKVLKCHYVGKPKGEWEVQVSHMNHFLRLYILYERSNNE